MRLFVVALREYLHAVRARGFVVVTLLAPFVMLALAALPGVVSRVTTSERRVLIVDGTGTLASHLDPARPSRAPSPFDPSALFGGGALRFETVTASGARAFIEAERTALARLDGAERADAVLLVPPGALDAERPELSAVARSEMDAATLEELTSVASRAVRGARAQAMGIAQDDLAFLDAGVRVSAKAIGGSGVPGIGLGFAFATLLFLPMITHGQRVMANIIKEKNDRVMEVVLSSIDAKTLFAGKVLAATAVALTQVAVWLLVGSVFAAWLPDARALDRPELAVAFLVFFLLGHLVHLCLYMMAGAASDSIEEAGQKLAPVTVATTAQLLLIMPVILRPHASFAVLASIVPPPAPATMFVRLLGGGVPGWQVLASILTTTVAIVLLLRVAARIFRAGVLAHGRRPTFRELWSWTQ